MSEEKQCELCGVSPVLCATDTVLATSYDANKGTRAVEAELSRPLSCSAGTEGRSERLPLLLLQLVEYSYSCFVRVQKMANVAADLLCSRLRRHGRPGYFQMRLKKRIARENISGIHVTVSTAQLPRNIIEKRFVGSLLHIWQAPGRRRGRSTNLVSAINRNPPIRKWIGFSA